MKINKELMKGSTSILILTLLKSEDMYGYQITQELERRSDSTFEMKEGTLYPMLHALEKEGAVESYWYDTDEGRRRKSIFSVTPAIWPSPSPRESLKERG